MSTARCLGVGSRWGDEQGFRPGPLASLNPLARLWCFRLGTEMTLVPLLKPTDRPHPVQPSTIPHSSGMVAVSCPWTDDKHSRLGHAAISPALSLFIFQNHLHRLKGKRVGRSQTLDSIVWVLQPQCPLSLIHSFLFVYSSQFAQRTIEMDAPSLSFSPLRLSVPPPYFSPSESFEKKKWFESAVCLVLPVSNSVKSTEENI